MVDVGGGGKWPWPRNVGALGTHPEEVRALKKSVEKNPDASPVPDVAPSRFLDPQRTAESLRIGDPDSVYDPAMETFQVTLTHVIFRRVLSKMRRRNAVLFDDAVGSARLDASLPSGRREQMSRMIGREHKMLDILDRYNSLAEGVYMRLLASSKG